MKKIVMFITGLGICSAQLSAQSLVPPPGASPHATVSEHIGVTEVTISYSRPAVNGREGKIWGGVVHQGYATLNYGNGNPAPWRAGDNENTTVEFSTDVLIEGHELPAGKYAIFFDYEGESNNTVAIFSKNCTGWGSCFYDDRQAAMKVEVSPVKLQQSTERLTYQFTNENDSGAVMLLIWEKLAIPIRISTKLRDMQVAAINREMQGEKGLDLSSQIQAAQYLYEHDVCLIDALMYATRAAYHTPSFSTLLLKGMIMQKLGMKKVADTTIQEALDRGNANEVFTYGRLLQSQGKPQLALEVFQFNDHRSPNTFITNYGLSQGYAGVGKKKEAIRYAETAEKQATDADNKAAIHEVIERLRNEK